jgi:hypothetical protein
MGTHRSISELERAIRANHGLIMKVARVLDLKPQSVYKRIAAVPRLQKVLEEVREEHLDLAEE